MAKNVFIRSECKYLLSDDKRAELEKYLGGFMKPDSYNGNGGIYSIRNIYFDSPDDYLISRSLEHPVYKEKLRLCGYDGEVGKNDIVYFEIKKKFDGVVYKRRTPIILSDAYEYIKTGKVPSGGVINDQVMAETDRMMKNYGLVPKLYLSYDRHALTDGGTLRITFDDNIMTRRNNLFLGDISGCSPILPEGMKLMELKCIGAIPYGLARKLSELGIFMASYSKYGEEYKEYSKNNFNCRRA